MKISAGLLTGFAAVITAAGTTCGVIADNFDIEFHLTEDEAPLVSVSEVWDEDEAYGPEQSALWEEAGQ